MNKNGLIDAIAAKTGSTKADAARAVTALTGIIAETLQKGDPSRWWDLGLLRCAAAARAPAVIPRQVKN